LVHDIGHPPFGHAGEKALDAAMRTRGESFDHNLHALRIVEDFELRYADFRGLNLTFEVREGIIKHSRDWSAAEYPQLSEYLLDQRPPLEAQLIDLADEIAYNAADLDDGFEAHVLSLDDVREQVELFEVFFREAEKRYPQAQAKLQFNEALKRMLDRMVTDLITNTRDRLRRSGVDSVQKVRRHPERMAAFSAEVERQRAQAKSFLYEHLYFSPELSPEKVSAEEVIGDMFEYWTRNPEALPHSYHDKARQEPLARVVCDYIAGMTDNFILAQHAKLRGKEVSL
jgi:dGTPase